MKKLNNEELETISGGEFTNRECMIAGAIATAGAAFFWTGIGAGAALLGVGSALNGGCFR